MDAFSMMKTAAVLLGIAAIGGLVMPSSGSGALIGRQRYS
jgi:hypothetical protein